MKERKTNIEKASRSPAEQQEREYDRPYHHLILDTGSGIPYISLLRVLKRLIMPAAGRRLLDAGCGDGRFLREFSGSGASIFGIDTSQRALRFAAGFTPEALISVQDLGDLAFPDGCFDAVTMIETLEHIPPAAVPRALSEARRVLAADGRMICTVPTHRLPRPPKHYRHFSPEELHSLLSGYFAVESLAGHDRDSRFYRILAVLGDNRLWHLRCGYNGMLRRLYINLCEDAPPGMARRLIAVCSRKD